MTVYDPIYPWKRWSDRLTFSPAVRVGDLLFISGLTATDENLDIVGPNDIVEQTRHIYRKMGEILAAAGAGFDNVVETVDYVVTLEDYSRTAEVRREFFKGPPYPAATGIQVAGLVRDDALIEIKALAVLKP